jgi:cardiolipin synthase
MAAWALLAVAGCAMPPIDRYMLEEARGTPVRVETARGPLSWQQSHKVLEDLKKRSPETSIFDRHVALEEAIVGSPLSVGNKAVLLEDGAAAYPAMLEAIKSAKRHVHVEVYIFEEDQAGQRFADALIERARAGVKVRVMYDAIGSKNTSKEFFDAMKKAGVEVFEYHPVDPASVLKGANINQRNHRKLYVVDGRVAFLGGINISEVYSSSSGPRIGDVPFDKRPWRDTQLEVQGPIVNDLQKSFVALWEKETKQKLADADLYPQQKPEGPLAMRAIEGTADQQGLNPLYVTFISAISSAESSVHITMAYFVPDEQLIRELKAAARRGVDVKLILPSRTDGWLVFHAGRSFYDDLLESGVKIYERKNRLLHSKYAVVDEVWSTVGSSNLDWRSMLHNLELNAIILGPDFGKRVEGLFEKDLALSEQITLEKWQHRPLQDRIREATARLWGFML